MESHYKVPGILRLVDIKKEDYTSVEDVADARLLGVTSINELKNNEPKINDSVYPFDKIPRIFTTLEDWPQHTNLKCWMCDFTFDDIPKFVPTHVRETDKGDIEFATHGNMCSFNCAELWINIHYSKKDDQQWRAQDNLRLVYFIFTGRHISHIHPAPHKTELKSYGGDLDEEAFWKKLRDLDNISGLRDHTQGSIIPERDRIIVPKNERIQSALTTLRINAGLSGAPRLKETISKDGDAPIVNNKSIWSVCGLPNDIPKSTAITSYSSTIKIEPISNDDIDLVLADLDIF